MFKRSTVSFIVSAFIALALFSLSGCGGSSSTTTATTATGATLSGQVIQPAKGANPQPKFPSKSKVRGKSKAAQSQIQSRELKNQMILARRAKFDAAPETGLSGATCQLVDASTKKPVTDSNGQAITATTNASGNYELKGVPPGKGYAIIATQTVPGQGAVAIKVAVKEVKENETAVSVRKANEESTLATEKYLDEVKKAVESGKELDTVDLEKLEKFYEDMPDEQVESLYEKYDDAIEKAFEDGSLDFDEIDEVESAADVVADLWDAADEAFEGVIESYLGANWETLLADLEDAIADAEDNLQASLDALDAERTQPEDDYYEYLAQELTKLGITTTAVALHASFAQSETTLQASLNDAAATQADIDAAYERFYAEQELINFGVVLDDVDAKLDELEGALAAAFATNPTGTIDNFSIDDLQECPSGMEPDPFGGCVAISGFSCPEGTTFDDSKGDCIDPNTGIATCPSGTHEELHVSTNTMECVPDFIACPEGTHLDETTKECLDDISGAPVCPEGMIFSESGMCELAIEHDVTTQPGEITQEECLSFGGTYDAATGVCDIPAGAFETVTNLTMEECVAQGGKYEDNGNCHIPTMMAKGKKASTVEQDPLFNAWGDLWGFVDFMKASIVGKTLGITVTEPEMDLIDALMHIGFVDLDGDNIIEDTDASIDRAAIDAIAQEAAASIPAPSEPNWETIYSDGDLSDSEKAEINAYHESFDDYYDVYQDAYDAEFNKQLVAAIQKIGTAQIAWADSAQAMADKFTAIQNIQDTAYDAYIASWDSYWAAYETADGQNKYDLAYKTFDDALNAAYVAVIAQTGAADAQGAQDIISAAFEKAKGAYWSAVNSTFFDEDGDGVADPGEYCNEILTTEELNSIAGQFDDVPGESMAGDIGEFFSKLGASPTQVFTVKDAAASFENGSITQEEFDNTIESVFKAMFKDKGVKDTDVSEFFQKVDEAEADYFSDLEDAIDGDDDDGDGVSTVKGAVIDLTNDIKAAITMELVDSADKVVLVSDQQTTLLNTLVVVISGEEAETAQTKLRAKGKAV